MMTSGKYLLFRNRIDPILRACSAGTYAQQSILPQGDLMVYRGQTTFTRSESFYFSNSRAKAHRQQLLAVCRDLPKLNAVLPGTACTITSLELTRGGGSLAALKPQMAAAEQLFILMTLAGISTYRAVTSKSGITYLNADILYDFRDAVLPRH